MGNKSTKQEHSNTSPDNTDKKKRKYFQMELTPYRKALLKRVSDLDRFKGLNNSKLVEKMLELANDNTELFKSFLESEDTSTDTLKEMHSMIKIAFGDLAKEIKKINTRLSMIEDQLEDNQSIFSDD
jgi:hypothetical protein